jgi:nicotinate-nucleotide pyrophosphorylase (carboxylating)
MTRPLSRIAALPALVIEPIVRLALIEDLGRAGDITSTAVVDATTAMTAEIRARTAGVSAGYDAAELALRLIDPDCRFDTCHEEGAPFEAGTVLARITGRGQSLLAAERVMLNFIGSLSGVATLTSRYVAAIAGTQARIVCTRKTLPGMRALQKRAVRLGGGVNHRYGLDDAILIKDNHIAAAGGVLSALERARKACGHLRAIEIEVDTLEQLEEALINPPAAILLDNMGLTSLRTAVRMIDRRCVSEASGGVSLESVKDIAETGVDCISVGALTHSAGALDIGLDIATEIAGSAA